MIKFNFLVTGPIPGLLPVVTGYPCSVIALCMAETVMPDEYQRQGSGRDSNSNPAYQGRNPTGKFKLVPKSPTVN